MRLRARLLAEVRAFFAERAILEVETPVLGRCGVTDPHLHSLIARGAPGGPRFYLQTSPEFAMKRLLCAGSGPIYQVARAFRDGERGRQHSPEFTLVEWYRPGFDHHELMAEVELLIRRLLGVGPCERMSYAQAFERYAGIDPHRADVRGLRRQAERLGVDLATAAGAPGPEVWLDLILSHCVAPRLGSGQPVFLDDFPESQAALTGLRLDQDGTPVAERFELFIDGLEVANGGHELRDPHEQRRRFETDQKRRHALGLPEAAIDERLLAALAQGLPACSGVALGFDRLVMIAARLKRIGPALAFAVERA